MSVSFLTPIFEQYSMVTVCLIVIMHNSLLKEVKNHNRMLSLIGRAKMSTKTKKRFASSWFTLRQP